MNAGMAWAPFGLVGTAIPFEARLLAVVDAYDAMTEKRPYKQARGRAEAQAEVRRCAGRNYDPKVVEASLQVLTEKRGVLAEERALLAKRQSVSLLSTT